MPPVLHNLPAETADDVLSFLGTRDLHTLMALSTSDRAHYRTPHFFRLVVLYALHDRARAFSRMFMPLSDEAIDAMSLHVLQAAATARGIIIDNPAKPTSFYWSEQAGYPHLVRARTITSSQQRALPSPFSSTPVMCAILKKWSAAVSGSPGFDSGRPSFSSCHRSCAAPFLGLSSVSLSSPVWEHAAKVLMVGEWIDTHVDYDVYTKGLIAALSPCFELTLGGTLADQHVGGAFLQPWSRGVAQRAAPEGARFDGPGLFVPVSGQMLPTYLDAAAIKLLHDAATPVHDAGNRYSSLAPPLFSVTSSSWQRNVTGDYAESVLGDAMYSIAPDVSPSDVCAITSQIIILQEGDSIASFSPAAASAPGALATLFVDLPTDCVAEHSSSLPSLPVLQGGDLLATSDPTRVGGTSIRADGSATAIKTLARSLGCPVLPRGGLATDPNEAHGTLFSWLAIASGQPVSVTPVTSGCKVVLVFTLHYKDPLTSVTRQPRPPLIAYDDAVSVLHHLLPAACGGDNLKPQSASVYIRYAGLGSPRCRGKFDWGDANAIRDADPVTLFDIFCHGTKCGGPSLSIPTCAIYTGGGPTFALDSDDGLLRGKDLAIFELLRDAVGGLAREDDEAAKMVDWIGRNSGTGVWSDIASQLGGAGGIATLLAEDADRYIPTSTSSGLRVIGSHALARGWSEGDASVDWGILDEGWNSFSDMEDGYPHDMIIEFNASVTDVLRSVQPENVDGGYEETWLIEVRKVPTITVKLSGS
ncbi:hypothetical protein TeGR_g13979 [Tetraparma gracilis]|uniref:F-box domain-containing protein n=1 Tax=Tetraparma gracilis TaxID=2962635 RepID=A0ABQ6N7S4_9STRA|nr:hypothetical protein TeGR_g13979 [Tetraparma gracilis]